MKFIEKIVKSINLNDSNYVDSNGVTQIYKPLEIYLVPKGHGDTTHDRYVVDQIGAISKHNPSQPAWRGGGAADGQGRSTGTYLSQPYEAPMYFYSFVTDANTNNSIYTTFYQDATYSIANYPVVAVGTDVNGYGYRQLYDPNYGSDFYGNFNSNGSNISTQFSMGMNNTLLNRTKYGANFKGRRTRATIELDVEANESSSSLSEYDPDNNHTKDVSTVLDIADFSYKINLNQYSGVFDNSEIKFGKTSLIIPTIPNVEGDKDYVRKLVQKIDGNIGFVADEEFSEKVNLTLDNNLSGQAYYKFNKEFALLTLNISGKLGPGEGVIADDNQSAFGNFQKIIPVVADNREIKFIRLTGFEGQPGMVINKMFNEDNFNFYLSDTFLVPFVGWVAV